MDIKCNVWYEAAEFVYVFVRGLQRISHKNMDNTIFKKDKQEVNIFFIEILKRPCRAKMFLLILYLSINAFKFLIFSKSEPPVHFFSNGFLWRGKSPKIFNFNQDFYVNSIACLISNILE